jgi:signal transduction histidine kinase
MTISLRRRIVLLLLPLLLLLAALGIACVLLLVHLGNRIEAILHDNYRSVLYMERLGEALERIDSSFQFALATKKKEKTAREQYDTQWPIYREWLDKEEQNITEPGEDELVQELKRLTEKYRRQGKDFYKGPAGDPRREEDYFGTGGLADTFTQLKDVSGKILRLNQKSMEEARNHALHTARDSLIGFGIGLVVVALLAGWLAWRTVQQLLRPIQSLTQAALGISAGNLDQVVPYLSGDELGQLAQAFNRMAHHLRDFRRSHSAQLLRAQQTSQATIDSIPDPVIVLDAEGRVEFANPAARRLLGVGPRLGGQTEAVPWNPPEVLRAPIRDALSGERDYLPEGFDHAILLGGQGRERALLPRILTIHSPSGNLLGVAVVLQDVTRLRLLDQVKSNLVATASHELKTPLTSVRLVIHLLLEETVGPLTPKQQELLLDARDNSERLLAMVNNLLDLARLEQGQRQLEVHPETPESLLRTAAEAVAPRAEDKGVTVHVEVPPGLPPVEVDAVRMGNALGNLLDNALNYTARGGTITLSAAAEDGAVALSVADTGVGIPEEYLPHVFEKFFRVPGQSRGAGTGLGLAIVNEIVTAHGGTITCESHPDRGTVFRLTLPAARDSALPEFIEGHVDGAGKTNVRK